MGTEPGGKLNRVPKKIVMLLDGLTGCGPDSNLNGSVALVVRVFSQFALNQSCAFHRGCSRYE
jgi:hypothetical protein